MPEWLECVKEQLRIPSKELITAPTAVAYGKDKTEWSGVGVGGLGRWGGGGERRATYVWVCLHNCTLEVQMRCTERCFIR